MRLAARAGPRDQRRPRQVVELPEHAVQRAVAQRAVDACTALAAIAQADRVAVEPHVPRAQGRGAEGVVLPGIVGTADAQGRAVEKRQQCRDGEILVAGIVLPQVAQDPSAQAGQSGTEGGQVGVFRLCPEGGPVRVVAVLLALARVAAGGLQMAQGFRRNPDVAIGRRHRQRVQPLALGLVVDAGAVRGRIAPAAALPPPGDAGAVIGVVDEVGHGLHGG